MQQTLSLGSNAKPLGRFEELSYDSNGLKSQFHV